MTIQGLQELDEEQLHRLRELIRKERKSIVFTHIPEELWQYCENAIEKKKMDDSLLLSLNNVGVDVIFNYLTQWFQKACEVTGRNLNQLTKALDFNPNDIKKGRIDSFLAEIRALFFLSEQKFTDIDPLERKKKGKQCDFVAKRGSRTFAIEVFHSLQPSDPKSYRDSEFVKVLCNRFRNKKSQMDASLYKNDRQLGLFIYVLDRFTSNPMTSKSRFYENLRCASSELNWEERYYFAIVTGSVTRGILEDTVFPPFETVDP